jgi:uncharacterized protein (DUF433 family)
MSAEIAALLARITVEPGQRSGKPCIRRMRMTVSDVLALLASGLSREEIVSEDNYPWLEIEDFDAALLYAARALDHPPVHARISSAQVQDERLVVELADGRIVSAPLAWFPQLLFTTETERANWRIVDGGKGLHWPDIHEDVHVESLLRSAMSPEAPQEASP